MEDKSVCGDRFRHQICCHTFPDGQMAYNIATACSIDTRTPALYYSLLYLWMYGGNARMYDT